MAKAPTVVNVRLATLADAAEIGSMSRRHIEWGLGWRWTPSRIRHSISHKSTNVAVIDHGDLLRAFGIMEYGDAHAHLALLGVRPSSRMRGLGSLLVAWLEKCADAAGIARIQVET